MKKIVLILVFITCCQVLFAADSIFNHPLNDSNKQAFNQVQKLLSENTNLEGQFKQVRHIKVLSSPLESNGDFSISQKSGLHWDQALPFESKLTVTDDKIVQVIQNSPPTIITKEKQPIVFSFTKIFLSVFKGNTPALESYFNIYFSGNTEHWEIALKPKGSPLDKAIASIELEGAKYVHTVTIKETRGNTLDIEFLNVKPISK
jgi:outer membrane lipoprotein-sorting protein